MYFVLINLIYYFYTYIVNHTNSNLKEILQFY